MYKKVEFPKFVYFKNETSIIVNNPKELKSAGECFESPVEAAEAAKAESAADELFDPPKPPKTEKIDVTGKNSHRRGPNKARN